MKRLFLAVTVLATGTLGVAGLRQATLHTRERAKATSNLLVAHRQFLATARSELNQLGQDVAALRHDLGTQGVFTEPAASDTLLSCIGARHLTPEQSERLLAELGFNWGTTGDYLVVSKDSLTAISLVPLHGPQLTQVGCDVLGITPDEQGAIERLAQSLTESYRAWALEHVQREEPGGEILAKYSLPADAGFSGSLSNQFTQGIMAALGEERGSYFLYYSRQWILETGIYGTGPRILTVFRPPAKEGSGLPFRLESPTMKLNSFASPQNPFPEAFLPLFPNGWADLAQREGFSLPAEFNSPPQ